MGDGLLRWLYRRLGRRYPMVVLVAHLQVAHIVVFAGAALLTLYTPMSAGEFWTVVAVAELAMFVDNLYSAWRIKRLLEPARPWLSGERSPSTALDAWRALVGLPVAFTRRGALAPAVLSTVPVIVAITLVLGLPWYQGVFILLGSSVVAAYGITLRFLTMELLLRPPIEDVSADLTDEVQIGAASLPLRWRLLAVLPLINVITGVVVSGLSNGGAGSLSDLGFSVLFALGVSFTISLELTILLTRSIVTPIDNLRRATERVAEGSLDVRVPVLATDETGDLSRSFNSMVAGLEEREKLREALGYYVDPEVAEQIVAAENSVLEGDEVEVSILFLDIRGFTGFAERASAREVVEQLNNFWELVVPILTRHRGHANKFVGDGLLGVFGAPDRLPDHADRALTAALEIAEAVERRYSGYVRIGVGVNSGPVIAGTTGGGGRLEFSVIGDAVNTAARVEEVTRETGDTVLLTEATRCLLGRDFGELIPRAERALKGKRDRVTLYAPASAAEAQPPVEAHPRFEDQPLRDPTPTDPAGAPAAPA
jgi:adenylate cyclase